MATSAAAQTSPQQPESLGKPINWTKADLVEPAALARILNDPKSAKPLIFNIGSVDNIKGARNMGAASREDNLKKFSAAIKAMPKNTSMVIYCGCCPFSRCPNVRPAVAALQAMGFSKAKLLNLPTNIKTDWIAKGYPMAAN